jgi:hypothetical protein
MIPKNKNVCRLVWHLDKMIFCSTYTLKYRAVSSTVIIQRAIETQL